MGNSPAWNPDPGTAQPIQQAGGWNPDPSTAQVIGGTPIQDKSTIGPRLGGATSWLQDLENDLRYGSGNTFIGRALQKAGAEGLNVGSQAQAGDFAGSLPLGTVRAARGVTELPSHPWQGTKDIAAGTLQASTIPASVAVGPGAEAVGGTMEAGQAIKTAASATDEWQKINEVLGVGAKGVRIGKQATSLEQAATMPGRALANLGYTSDELTKMTPLERMATVAPHWQQAGKAIDTATQAATDAGQTLDAGKSAFNVLKQIGPEYQDKAIATFNNLAKGVGIENQRAATPEQVLALRQALSGGARFGPSGDLSSLGGIRAQLYRAVSGDLKEAVPTLKQLDQDYSDLKGAVDAAQSSVSKFAAKAPPETPSTTQKILSKAGPIAVRAAGAGAGYAAYRTLRDLLP